MSTGKHRLSVAVTGPTGTFGFGLIPLLQSEERVGRIVGIARRPFDPREHGWTKMEYRQGDVRDAAALREGFAGADVVVHLAFMITGNAPAKTIREINVTGTLNAFKAARDAGAQRFVYASSVAAYGFHADNPVGMREDWPVRPADRLLSCPPRPTGWRRSATPRSWIRPRRGRNWDGGRSTARSRRFETRCVATAGDWADARGANAQSTAGRRSPLLALAWSSANGR